MAGDNVDYKDMDMVAHGRPAVSDPFRLDGKAALVTGANTGIGQAIAVALASAGAEVIAAGRSSLDETLALIAAGGRRRRALKLSLDDPRPRPTTLARPSARSTSWSTTPASSAAPTPSTSPRPTGTR